MARKKALRRKQPKREATPNTRCSEPRTFEQVSHDLHARFLLLGTEDPDVIRAEFEELEKQGP